jgi:hypothetical protein
MQLMFTIAKATDFDLTSIEPSLAKDTNPLIIERIPVLELVLGTQDRKSIFRPEVSVHCWREIACAIAENTQSGQRMIVWSGKFL